MYFARLVIFQFGMLSEAGNQVVVETFINNLKGTVNSVLFFYQKMYWSFD